MKQLSFLLILTFCTSCHYFETEKVYSDDLFQQELEAINWNDVDQYPSFSVCDSITARQASKQCFENTLLQHVNQFLSDQNLVVNQDVNDTIVLDITIDNKGELDIEQIKAKEETRLILPEIDSLLTQSLRQLPKVYPAIKRGQQVKTKFQFPVVVKIQ
ncbi:MAG: hypothetical protein AAF901_12560 [Bacteroidota bacterium]